MKIAAWEQDRNANHTKANWHFHDPKMPPYQTQATFTLQI